MVAPLVAFMAGRFAVEHRKHIAFAVLTFLALIVVIIGAVMDEPWVWGLALAVPVVVYGINFMMKKKGEPYHTTAPVMLEEPSNTSSDTLSNASLPY